MYWTRGHMVPWFLVFVLATVIGNCSEAEPFAICPTGHCPVILAASNGHTCALVGRPGTVWCWGGYYGETKDIRNGEMSLPKQVMGQDGTSPLDGVLAISSGCAVLSDGEILALIDLWPVGPGVPSALESVRAVSAGGSRACALLSDGTVACWGSEKGLPELVAAQDGSALGDFLEVSTGSHHACGRRADGTVWCWGWNKWGQLGDGTTVDRETPRPVVTRNGSPLQPVKQVSSGAFHTCALLADGTAYCWGNNVNGQLGDGGTSDEQNRPVQVQSGPGSPLTGIRMVAAGKYATCFLLEDGSVLCTKLDEYPKPVLTRDGAEFQGVVSLSAGAHHVCALTDDHRVWCWGSNETGQLGDGSREDSEHPVAVLTEGGSPLEHVVAVSAGGGHTCAVTQDGHAYCWGANRCGVLGDGTEEDRSTAVPVTFRDGAPFEAVVSVSAGDESTCATTMAGRAWCWGDRTKGRLGDRWVESSRIDCVPYPVLVKGIAKTAPLPSVAAISGSEYHTCIVGTDSTVWCWSHGFDPFVPPPGVLGDGMDHGSFDPVQVLGPRGEPLLDAVAVSAGEVHSCSILANGTVWCWGSNAYGLAGLDPSVDLALVATQIRLDTGEPLGDVDEISAGSLHTCAKRIDGTVWCWGRNDRKQLGMGPGQTQYPVEIRMEDGYPLQDVEHIAAGGNHTCAIVSDGSAWCWGDNSFGQLGNGSASEASFPVQVLTSGGPVLDDLVQIVAGNAHTCAVARDGHVWCWGAFAVARAPEFSSPDAITSKAVRIVGF